jgi:plasmid maintenance system antidote protein VapI
LYSLSISETACRPHVSRQKLHDLLSERKGFTPEMALRIAFRPAQRLWLISTASTTIQIVSADVPAEHCIWRNNRW